MTILGRLIPSWIPLAVIGALTIVAGGTIWLVLDAREELGAAKLRAAVNGAALSVIQQQEGCPPVPVYSRDFLARAAGEVERLPA